MTDNIGDLRRLAEKHGTDKAEHGYCEIYEGLIGGYRHAPIKLLELGVYKGASLRLWDEFFTNPDSDIIGIDISPPIDVRFGSRVRVYRGDQTECPLAMRGWLPDVIIDDASHISSKTIASFISWFQFLQPGGLYIVEDTATSYHPDYEGRPRPEERPNNPYIATTMQWFQRLTDQVNSWAFPEHCMWGEFKVASVAFHPDLIVVTKK